MTKLNFDPENKFTQMVFFVNNKPKKISVTQTDEK